MVVDVYVNMEVPEPTSQSSVVSQNEPFQTGSPAALTFPAGPISKITSALSITKAAKPMEIILFMCKYPLAKESEDLRFQIQIALIIYKRYMVMTLNYPLSLLFMKDYKCNVPPSLILSFLFLCSMKIKKKYCIQYPLREAFHYFFPL
jgi:hypothetical protein